MYIVSFVRFKHIELHFETQRYTEKIIANCIRYTALTRPNCLHSTMYCFLLYVEVKYVLQGLIKSLLFVRYIDTIVVATPLSLLLCILVKFVYCPISVVNVIFKKFKKKKEE